MDLAYFMTPVHPPEKDYHLTLEEDADAIRHADALGYSEVWVSERYSSAVEQITSPLMFMASVVHQTKQITLATGVICLARYHPALVAGQTAMFDHLSEGRFIMGIGPGGLPPDFELFGTGDADRGEMMVESIDTILQLWTTDPPYDIQDKYWQSSVRD